MDLPWWAGLFEPREQAGFTIVVGFDFDDHARRSYGFVHSSESVSPKKKGPAVLRRALHSTRSYQTIACWLLVHPFHAVVVAMPATAHGFLLLFRDVGDHDFGRQHQRRH